MPSLVYDFSGKENLPPDARDGVRDLLSEEDLADLGDEAPEPAAGEDSGSGDPKLAQLDLQHKQKLEMMDRQTAQGAASTAEETRQKKLHLSRVNHYMNNVRKNNPTGGDVHIDQPLTKPKRKKTVETEIFAPITKIDEEHRMVYGFATVSETGGEPYFDNQGDHVGVDTIRKAWHDYVGTPRTGGVNHERMNGGSVVEGLVIDDSVASALTEALQKGYRGLFIGYHATDDAAWDGVKKGELTGFSIGGRGKRKSLD